MTGRKGDASLNTSFNSEPDDFMPEFNAKVRKAQQLLEKIKYNNERVEEMRDRY
jgi:hypothetical protein